MNGAAEPSPECILYGEVSMNKSIAAIELQRIVNEYIDNKAERDVT